MTYVVLKINRINKTVFFQMSLYLALACFFLVGNAHGRHLSVTSIHKGAYPTTKTAVTHPYAKAVATYPPEDISRKPTKAVFFQNVYVFFIGYWNQEDLGNPAEGRGFDPGPWYITYSPCVNTIHYKFDNETKTYSYKLVILHLQK